MTTWPTLVQSAPDDVVKKPAYVELYSDSSKLVTGLAAASTRLQAWGRSLMTLGTQLAVPLGVATYFGGSFEQAMANLRAAVNPTQEDFDLLREKILAVARDTGTSSTEVANGFSELAKAGMNIPLIIGGAGEALIKFAGVGKMPVTDAVLALVGGLNVFAKQGVTPSIVMNSISSAADASLSSIKDITDAFSEAGGVLASYGMKLDDVDAAIAILSQNMLKGGEAGTALKTMMMRLANPTGQVGEALQELGLSTRDLRDANEDFLQFPELVDKLAAAGNRLSKTGMQQAFAKLSGQRGGRALELLVKGGSKALEEMKAEMAKALPVEAKFAIMQDTLWGALKKMGVALEQVAITITDILAPVLRPIGAAFLGVVRAIDLWIKANPALVKGFLGLVFGLLATGATLWTVGKGIGLLSGSIGLIVGALKLVLIPFAILKGLLNAVWVALLISKAAWLGFGAVFVAIQAILTPGMAAWNALIAMNTALTAGMAAAWAALETVVLGLPFLVLAAGIVAVLNAALTGDSLIRNFGEAWTNLKTTVVTAWTGISDALGAGNLQLAWEIALKGLEIAWLNMWIAMQGAWIDFKSNFLTGMKLMLNEIGAAIAKDLIANFLKIHMLINPASGLVHKLALQAAGLPTTAEEVENLRMKNAARIQNEHIEAITTDKKSELKGDRDALALKKIELENAAEEASIQAAQQAARAEAAAEAAIKGASKGTTDGANMLGLNIPPPGESRGTFSSESVEFLGASVTVADKITETNQKLDEVNNRLGMIAGHTVPEPTVSLG